MAAVGVGTKYHVALRGQGYLLAGLQGYIKRDADVFVPRFSTGEQGVGDLDIYKTWQQTDFSGGAFQQRSEKGREAGFAEAKNMHRSPVNGRLYPRPQVVNPQAGYQVGYWAVFRGTLYAAALDKVYSVNQTTGAYTLVQTLNTSVTDMVVSNDHLYVAQGTTYFMRRMNSAGAWDAGSSAFRPIKLAHFNGKLYASGGTAGGQLFSFESSQNTTIALTTTAFLGRIGDQYYNINRFKVYNGRIMMGKPDGLFAYDGVRTQQLIDTSGAIDELNFAHMEVYNGILCYSIRESLYRLSGATLEKVQTFRNPVSALLTANDKLMIGIEYGDSLLQSDTVIYAYDGVGMTAYVAKEDAGSYVRSLGYWSGVIADVPSKHLFIGHGTSPPLTSMIAMHKEFSNTPAVPDAFPGLTTVSYESSEIDGGFPLVDKYLDSVAVEYEDAVAGDTFTMSVRIYDGAAWGSWTQVGSGTGANGKRRFYMHDTDLSGTFRAIQVRLEVSANDYVSIKSVSADYILSPNYKREWELGLIAQNPNETLGNSLTLLDNSTETVTSAALREKVYAARAMDAPVGFEDVDFTRVNGAINAAITTVTVDTTNAFPSSGFIKIDDEIIEYTGKTATTFTGCTRGELDTTAASHSDNAIVNVYYRVVVSRIVRERTLLPDPGSEEDANGLQSDITVVLKQAS